MGFHSTNRQLWTLWAAVTATPVLLVVCAWRPSLGKGQGAQQTGTSAVPGSAGSRGRAHGGETGPPLATQRTGASQCRPQHQIGCRPIFFFCLWQTHRAHPPLPFHPPGLTILVFLVFSTRLQGDQPFFPFCSSPMAPLGWAHATARLNLGVCVGQVCRSSFVYSPIRHLSARSLLYRPVSTLLPPPHSLALVLQTSSNSQHHDHIFSSFTLSGFIRHLQRALPYTHTPTHLF